MNNETSRRVRRMQRHHKSNKGTALNLVSLMDIFTILVFFLLVNSSSAPQLPNKSHLKLPDSIAQKAPQETLLVSITREDILVQGKKVIEISQVNKNISAPIDSLVTELEYHAKSYDVDRVKQGLAVTILGDENSSFELINKILKSCQLANFTKVSFAANRTVQNTQ